MNRCFLTASSGRSMAGIVLASFLLAAPFWAGAQSSEPQRIPPMSAKSVPGTLRIVQPPDVLLNGKPARLAPGARIRDRNNLLAVSGSLIGQDLVVRYTLDYLGLVHEVWVLTPAEAAASPLPQSFANPAGPYQGQ